MNPLEPCRTNPDLDQGVIEYFIRIKKEDLNETLVKLAERIARVMKDKKLTIESSLVPQKMRKLIYERNSRHPVEVYENYHMCTENFAFDVCDIRFIPHKNASKHVHCYPKQNTWTHREFLHSSMSKMRTNHQKDVFLAWFHFYNPVMIKIGESIFQIESALENKTKKLIQGGLPVRRKQQPKRQPNSSTNLSKPAYQPPSKVIRTRTNIGPKKSTVYSAPEAKNLSGFGGLTNEEEDVEMLDESTNQSNVPDEPTNQPNAVQQIDADVHNTHTDGADFCKSDDNPSQSTVTQ